MINLSDINEKLSCVLSRSTVFWSITSRISNSWFQLKVLIIDVSTLTVSFNTFGVTFSAFWFSCFLFYFVDCCRVSCFTLHFLSLSLTASTCVLLIGCCEVKPRFSRHYFGSSTSPACRLAVVLFRSLSSCLCSKWFVLWISVYFKAHFFFLLPVCIWVFFASLFFLSKAKFDLSTSL